MESTMHFTDHLKRGTHNTLQFNNSANLSFKGPATTVYVDTEIDSWYVGDFSSASYHITVEFDSNQKETLQVLVIARPEHASYTIFGRISIDDELITLSASVTNSKMTLTANPKDPAFLGARVIFTATYSETISPLALPTAVSTLSDGAGSNGGTPVTIQPSFSTISVTDQTDVVASIESDTLSLLAGSGIALTTNAISKSITLSSNINMFNNVVVSGYAALSPASSTDILTFTAGNGVLISPNALTKTITVSAPIASTSVLGSVKVDGTSITINNGVISSVSGTANSLPIASTSTLGGVKVDGSTITISNDGVISSSGGGGVGGLVITSLQTANYIATPSQLVNVNTTNNSISVTLPSLPTNGTVVGIIDALGKFAINPVTVYPGANATIENDTSLLLDIVNTYITFIFVAATNNWRIQSTPAVTVNGTNYQSLIGTINGIAKGNGANALTAATAGTDYVSPNTATLFTKPQRPSLSDETAPASGVITWDLTSHQIFRIVLSSNITTFNLTGTLASLVGYQYELIIRYTGGATISWNTNFKWTASTAPTLTGVIGKTDVLTFVVSSTDGVNFHLVNTGIKLNVG
jgi:hypothetical protein